MTAPDRGVCRSCNAAILWAVMAVSGKKAPLDALPVTIAPDKPERTLYLIREDGRCVGVRGRFGHKNHFETCPARERHREKPEAPKPVAQGGLFG